MRRRFIPAVIWGAMSALLLVMSAAPASAENDRASKPPVPTEVANDTSSPDAIPVGAIATVWGLDSNGDPFFYTYQQTADSPPRGATVDHPTMKGVPVQRPNGRKDTPSSGPESDPHPQDSKSGPPSSSSSSETMTAASATCTVYISDVYVAYNNDFKWETNQFCSGSFGQQYHRTQMWRSSWSGPRGYGGWGTTPLTTATSQPRTWTIRCGSGGTYDYYPVIEGYASAIGYSPTTRSNNQLRRSCGTSP